MKKLPAQENKIKRIIQDTIAMEPGVSTERVTNILFDKGVRTANNKPLDWHYVHKLRAKLHREGLAGLDRGEVKERIHEARERYRLFTSQLIRIAYATDDWDKEKLPQPTHRDRIAAMRAIMQHDIKFINTEIETGVLRGEEAELEEVKRSKPINSETRAAIFNAVKKRFNLNDGTN